MLQSRRIHQRIAALLARQSFFWVIVGLLVLQAAWIALSGRYPMAFDEDFHLGIIRLYAHHISPFWSAHPAGADAYGAVARDPSYLYHWLMSFPYRLVSVFTGNQMAQVLCLRFLNIGLFAAGLLLYRRLLLKATESRALVHAVLLLFVLLPVVPLLAAQINYDNLFLPLTALSVLLVTEVIQELRSYKRLNVWFLMWWLVIGLLATLVKYAFLPILFAEAIVIGFTLVRTYPGWRKFFQSAAFGVSLIPPRRRWVLLVALLVSLVLFGERYGLNTIRYHTPVPDCDQVLTVKQCRAYGPWARDYTLESIKDTTHTEHGPVIFTGHWFYGMWFRTYFAVDGPATQFQTRGPLIIPAVSGIVLASLSGLAVVICGQGAWRANRQRHVLGLFTAVSLLYVGLLWIDEYRAFLRTGQPVAINGRYLFPVLPLILLLAGLSLAQLLRRWPAAKSLLVMAAVLTAVWGGGAFTYILRSTDQWYWTHTPTKIVNHAVQRTLGPLSPGYNQPTKYLH
jgi:hypothetical protein